MVLRGGQKFNSSKASTMDRKFVGPIKFSHQPQFLLVAPRASSYSRVRKFGPPMLATRPSPPTSVATSSYTSTSTAARIHLQRALSIPLPESWWLDLLPGGSICSTTARSPPCSLDPLLRPCSVHFLHATPARAASTCSPLSLGGAAPSCSPPLPGGVFSSYSGHREKRPNQFAAVRSIPSLL
jgi:hypothetical protein